MKNSVILLYGYPATGKLTIARELAKLSNAVLIDNHLINNPLFQVIRADGKSEVPEAIWGYVQRMREIVLQAIAELGAADDSFIFTGCLYEEYALDHETFTRLKRLAAARNARFIPVRLTCPLEILKQRISNPERKVYMKLNTTPELERLHDQYTLLQTDHPDLITLDTSQYSAADTARTIFERIGS